LGIFQLVQPVHGLVEEGQARRFAD
jgi:hypothetical protein